MVPKSVSTATRPLAGVPAARAHVRSRCVRSHSRAKVKNEAKKVAAIREANASKDASDKSAPSPPASPSPAPQPPSEPAGDAQGGRPETGHSEGSDGSSASGDTETPGTSAPENEEGKDMAVPAPSLPTVNIAFTSPFGGASDDLGSAQSASAGEAETGLFNERGEYSPFQYPPGQSLAPPSHDLLALRRGSLPNLPLNPGSVPVETLDPHGQSFRTNAYGAGNTYNSAPAVPYDLQARRASIATTDSHAMRLSAHPYAHLARAANSGRTGHMMLSLRPSPTHSPASRLHSIAHSPSHNALRRASIAAGMEAGSFPPPPGMMRAYTQPAGMGMGAYTGSSRPVPAPPPGPLPEQGFSFGAPPAGYESRGSMSSEPEEERERYAEWERVRGRERFGSVASVASHVSAASGMSEFGGAGGSESSWTSWYPSEEGGGAKDGGEMSVEGRRGSW